MKDKRFRYLEKFVGKYRVLAEYDYGTGTFPKSPTFEDFYIPCSKGMIKHTYDSTYELVWVCLEKIGTSRNVDKALQEMKHKIDYKYEEIGDDAMIWFHEEDLGIIAKLVKPRTSGSRIPPMSTKNLPKAAYKIPDEDENLLKELMAPLSQPDKLKYGKQWPRDFDAVIIKAKGKKYPLEEERDDSGMKPKQFIHSIGMWPDYLKFVKKQMKELK